MRALVAGLVLSTALTAVLGSLYLIGRDRTPPAAEKAEKPVAQQIPVTALDRLTPTTEPHAPAPVTPAAPRPTGGPGVTPSPPSVFAIARSSVPPQTMDAISKLKGVQKVAAFDAGAVKVSGQVVNLLAVEPAEFRSWTPKPVADQPAVWEALERGELIAEAGGARRLGLVLGASYQVDGGPRLRVAGSARLGLPGVDGVVSAEVGRGMGLLPGVAVLVQGAGGKATALGGVRRALGAGAQAMAVGEAAKDRAASGSTGTTEAASDVTRKRPPAAPQRVLVGRPGSYLELYRLSAGVCPGLSWTVLAAIGQVESSHGRNNGPSSAGALGPMQFMPATWKAYGVDGDGDGTADIWSPYDAVPSAANYLCANGANQGGKKLEKAIWFYNHSWDYVNKVLGVARSFAAAYPGDS
ncbi:hypothetical protein Misp01_28850 [Microtetraspora sp. NBRC 13810]|nr:hypothetical protein Misp01_28850 [Microtetraspora sp. NBRC 13810]